MRGALWHLFLCFFSTLCVNATPMNTRASFLDTQAVEHHQQRLGNDRTVTIHPARPVPNSVGVLFTKLGAAEVVHIWLPLGRKVYTRDAPDLPIHPLSARITTMIRSTPAQAMPEHLDRVTCIIYPLYNRENDRENGGWSISFSRSDGVVNLAEVGNASWLVGQEVEAYECS